MTKSEQLKAANRWELKKKQYAPQYPSLYQDEINDFKAHIVKKNMRKTHELNLFMMAMLIPASILGGLIVGSVAGEVAGVFAGFAVALLIAVPGAFGAYSDSSTFRPFGFINKLGLCAREIVLRMTTRGPIYVEVPEIMRWRPGSQIRVEDYPVRWDKNRVEPTDILAEFVGMTDRNTVVLRFPERYPDRVVELTAADLKLYDAADISEPDEHPKNVKERDLVHEAENSFATQRLIEFQKIMDGTEEELERMIETNQRQKNRV